MEELQRLGPQSSNRGIARGAMRRAASGGVAESDLAERTQARTVGRSA